MITPEPPAGSEHYREGWRHGYEQAAIDRERSADAGRLVPEVVACPARDSAGAPCWRTDPHGPDAHQAHPTIAERARAMGIKPSVDASEQIAALTGQPLSPPNTGQAATVAAPARLASAIRVHAELPEIIPTGDAVAHCAYLRARKALGTAIEVAADAIAGAVLDTGQARPADDKVIAVLARSAEHSDDSYLADEDAMRVVIEVLREHGMEITGPASAPDTGQAREPHRVLVYGENDRTEWQDCDGEDCETCGSQDTVQAPDMAELLRRLDEIDAGNQTFIPGGKLPAVIATAEVRALLGTDTTREETRDA